MAMGPHAPVLPAQDTAGFGRLTWRSDFLRAAKGRRFHAKGFTLQSARRADLPPEDALPRFGFTVTKKVGGAVVRNRIRRRLKEALRLLDPLPARPGHDYVVLARTEALDLPFSSLQAELGTALTRIDTARHGTSQAGNRHKPTRHEARRPDPGCAPGHAMKPRSSKGKAPKV
jgi:ribonuclease P protein component